MGDDIVIMGPTTGIIEQKVTNIRNAGGSEVSDAQKGEVISILTQERARTNDLVYKVVEANLVDD